MKRLAMLAAILALPSCNYDKDELPPIQAYFGATNMIGAEVAFGRHAFGLGVSYRALQLPTDVQYEEPETPIVYPVEN